MQAWLSLVGEGNHKLKECCVARSKKKVKHEESEVEWSDERLNDEEDGVTCLANQLDTVSLSAK
jgi:hypothetical protein